MPPVVGHKMKLYRNTGTVAVPVWQEVCEIGDVSVPDLAMGLAELKRRCNDFTKNLATLMQSISVEFRMIHGLGGAIFTALVGNFFAGTIEQWAVYNGDIATAGNEGLLLPALIEQFPWDQPLEEVSGHDVRLAVAYFEEPAGTEIDPAWQVTP